jgi:hypothetical protein
MEQKEIPLANLGLQVNPEREGILDAALFAHGANLEDGILMLTEQTILDGLFNDITPNLITIPDHSRADGLVKLEEELSTLEEIFTTKS